MDTKELIEKLRSISNMRSTSSFKRMICKMAAQRLEQLTTKGDGWIPVTERMPGLIPRAAGTAYSEAVIVWTSGRKAMIAIYDGNDFLCPARYWDAEGEEITHWRPLPKPPKEEQ